MRELAPVYGTHAFEEWENRVKSKKKWDNLSDTKEPPGSLCARPPLPIESFERLVEVISFLSVMNKTLILLYRGQTQDWALRPSLMRPRWSLRGAGTKPVELGQDRFHYWEQLELVEDIVLKTLMRHGLPRWRHLKYRQAARWAVIQHYELWPTPLLDFTSSLRVAATFAFDFDSNSPGGGILSVVGVERIRSDLMDADYKTEREDGTLAIRLNSVCPPRARRPHLQEGFLVGAHPFERAHVSNVDSSDAAAILIAKLALLSKGPGEFWSDDFPIHTRRSLLPEEEDDTLLRDFRESISYAVDDSGSISVRRAP